METFGYNILKKDSVGAPIWLEAVRDLDTARQRVAELAHNSPGEYVVFCVQTSQLVDCFVLA
jgi:selenocysteine lyase/cysteine desulfurase